MTMRSLIVLTSLAFLVMFGGLLAAKAADASKDRIKDPSSAPAKAKEEGKPASPLDFKVKSIDGKEMDLADYKGKVVLLVNVASRCGNTPQYDALESAYEKYKDQGLVVIGVPA